MLGSTKKEIRRRKTIRYVEPAVHALQDISNGRLMKASLPQILGVRIIMLGRGRQFIQKTIGVEFPVAFCPPRPQSINLITLSHVCV